jgi:CheY-like chemotaxis protein
MTEEPKIQPEISAQGTSVSTPSKPAEYPGYKLISDLFSSFASVIVGLAWPATALILAFLLAQNANGVMKTLTEFMKDKKTFEVSVGPKEGLMVKIAAREAESGLTRQIAAQSGTVSTDQQNSAQRAADSAASKLIPLASLRPEGPTKVLWVDDHPQNNIGLQYAFQALGMIVVCIDSNAGIHDAFATARGFDVVITDMFRDGVSKKPDEAEAGLQTLKIIAADHPKVPVIIYSGSYAAKHANDPLSAPVIADTNDPQRVFDLVSNIAARGTR